MGPATRYTLRRNTASVMKIWFFLCWNIFETVTLDHLWFIIDFFLLGTIVSNNAWQYRAQVTDPLRRVRLTAGADRIWHIYRVAADSKSAHSLCNLPELLLCSM